MAAKLRVLLHIFRYNYLNYIIMFICIDKTKTIHRFYCYFVEKMTDFPVISVDSV